MKITYNNHLIDIDDKFICSSPYLNTLANTSIGQDKEGDAYIIDDIPLVEKYLSYIQGELFSLDAEEKDEFFEVCNYFGHDMDAYRDLDVSMIPMKMHDNWIRDNLYKMDLWKNPLYGLVEVPIVSDRLSILSEIPVVADVYIAGGAAMYLAGWGDTYGDVDIFFARKEALHDMLKIRSVICLANRAKAKVIMEDEHIPIDEKIAIFKDLDINYDCTYIGSEIESIRISEHYIPRFGIYKNSIHICRSKAHTVSGILRLYKAPTEIVHGFDLDCCGILYDPSTCKLWATKRAIWSFANKMNIFDPARSSPSYVDRLTKYHRRGYDIHIPGFSFVSYDEEAITQWKNDVQEKYFDWLFHHLDGVVDFPGRDPEIDEAFRYEFVSKLSGIIDEKYLQMLQTNGLYGAGAMNPKCPWGQMVAYMGSIYGDRDSPVDRLILAKLFKVYYAGRKISDYVGSFEKETTKYNHASTTTSISIDIDEDSSCSETSGDESSSEIEYWKNEYREILYIDGDLDIPEIQWKEQNPMEQITSTFCPEPIPDMIKWLKKSKFVQ